MRKIWILSVLAAVAPACGGGDDGPKAMPGTVNATQARTTVSNAAGLRSSVESMNGQTVASSALAFNASSSGIVGPATGSSAKALGALTVGDLELIMQAQSTSGTQMCTATQCKFDKYTVNGMTLDGTLDVAPSGDAKNIKWNLTMKGSGLTGVPAGFSFDYNGKGNITVSAGSLNGDVTTTATSSGTQAGQSFSGGWESYVKFQSVVLSNGMASGGSIYAKVTSSGMSGGQSASMAYEGTHTF